jgi:hypothetical protein
MQKFRTILSQGWILILIAVLVIPSGCGDDDPAGPGETTYTNPNGKWSVTATGSDVQITDTTVPEILEPYLVALIEAVVTGDGESIWNVEQKTVVVTVLDILATPLCERIILPYNSNTRTVAASAPVTFTDIDLTPYDLCEDIPGLGQACVSTVSIDGVIGTDLQWAGDFTSFGGTFTVGSAADVAEATIVVTGVGAGTYTISFYGTWTLSGARCSSCETCQ